MTNILVLTSSAAGTASVSNQLVGGLIADWSRHDANLVVTTRDLGAEPLPHLDPARLPGLAGKVDTPEARDTLALADTLVAELKAADVIVIGSPMYNFGITTPLKAWFDHVLRAGVTFSYTPEGPKGHLHGKRAVVVESRGGFYSSGPAAAMDAQEPHLRTLLGFIGITDVTFVRAERLAVGPEARAEAIAAAAAELRTLRPVLALAA